MRHKNFNSRLSIQLDDATINIQLKGCGIEVESPQRSEDLERKARSQDYSISAADSPLTILINILQNIKTGNKKQKLSSLFANCGEKKKPGN